jgi:hypothetical protein
MAAVRTTGCLETVGSGYVSVVTLSQAAIYFRLWKNERRAFMREDYSQKQDSQKNNATLH